MSPRRRISKAEQGRREAAATEATRQARKAAKRGRALDRAAFNERLMAGVDVRALAEAMSRVLAAAEPAPPRRGSRRSAPRDLPAAAAGRWVPLGPSVVRRGQAMDRPRVTGRIRDLAVDATGTRAYAASAMGGVWYTEDGGSTWSPFGGWAQRPRVAGGITNGQAVGCLLVSFGATSAADVVLAGTGETTPTERTANPAPVGEGATGGVGVLCGRLPVDPGADDPWEADSGLAQLEGLGIFRLVRQPTKDPGAATGANADVVVACTSAGAFIGERQNVPGGGGQPARAAYVWRPMASLAAAHANAAVTDAVWLPSGRLILAVAGTGLIYTDDLGGSLRDIPTTQAPAVAIVGVMSLAVAQGNRIYLLGETGGAPTLWQIPDASLATPVATAVPTLPANLWGTQRDYDQAIAVDVVAGKDRVYVAGSAVQPRVNADYGASMYAFDVTTAPALGLAPAAGLATTGSPPAGDGADLAGLIGNNVHGDVHAIRITGTPGPRRQVWVATDGGVFVSDRCGRVQTFASMNTGIAALQPVFVRSHPSNGHVIGAGFQDNGTQIRSGDTVWDEVYEGDGGGLVFPPTAPHLLVRQYVQSSWYCTSSAAFIDPMTRNPGSPKNGVAVGNENAWSSFYSGAAAVAVPASGPSPAHSRLSVGTHRVWLTDDLGVGAGPNTWQTLPYPNGATFDGRPGVNGATTPVLETTGIANPWLGPIITMAWASATELLVLHLFGVVRYTESPPGTWTTKTWRLNDRRVAMPRNTTPTDIIPVPGVRNFYVMTTGVIGSAEETVWFYSPSDDQFHRTGFRHVLDSGNPVVTGPRDPAFSAVLDPTDRNIVFVGTATGVWRGHRTSATGDHTWTPFVNGLPQATVQDLDIWVDPNPGPGSPRLLRAGVQSRGVWEVDLANDAARRTWIRGSAWDDRRLPLALNANPLNAPPAVAGSFTASPDIVVRPKWQAPTPPKFASAPSMSSLAPWAYDVWTFQTAFRWLYPSVAATGVFTEALGNLVAFHRTTIGKTGVPVIDQAVWDDVVGGVHVSATGVVSYRPATAADPLAVFRAPWHTTRAPASVPTEVDLAELVVPPRSVGGTWTVYREPSTVDVLVHHRDSRAVPANGAFVVLLWRHDVTPAALMSLAPATVLAYLTSVAAGVAAPVPAGWTLASGGVGSATTPVPAPVDARMPRGASVDVDLSSVPANHHVLLLALVGSSSDDLPPLAPAIAPPTSITDLVRSWPYAAARVVQVVNRPA